jgi:hypothetical protein
VDPRQHIGKAAKLLPNSFPFSSQLHHVFKQTSNDLSEGLILSGNRTISQWQKAAYSYPMNKSLLGIAALILSVAPVSGQQLGTVEQARAMLDRAISALESNEATALSEFNDPNNKQFHERDLYVFCYDMSDGKITAYESPALLNIDVRTLTLKDDPIGKRAYEAVQNAPEGSIIMIDYKFPKPGTTEPVPKQTLETRIGNQGCGVTYYK